jgi:ribosomal protein L39E
MMGTTMYNKIRLGRASRFNVRRVPALLALGTAVGLAMLLLRN